MLSAPVFLDTAGLLALLNENDSLHQVAKRTKLELTRTRTIIVSSDWVLAEFLNFASRPRSRMIAQQAVQRLRESSRMDIQEASREAWDGTFQFYKQHGDKHWSFVDCSSMLICRTRGIKRVFTHDKDFEQFGLECLLRG